MEKPVIIHKQILSPFNGTELIKLPKDAEILTIKMQGPNLVLWFKFKSEFLDVIEGRMLFYFFTGTKFNESGMKYLDTVLVTQNIVYHIYEYMGTEWEQLKQMESFLI